MNLSAQPIETAWKDRVGNPSGYPLQSAIVENEAGDTYRVKLVADPNAGPGALTELPNTLRNEGYIDFFADVVEGQHILTLRGLKKEQAEKLPGWLQSKGLLASDGIEQNTKSKEELRKERLKRDTLKWSGRFAMAGSMGVAVAGAGQKDWGRLQTGLTLMAADSVVAIYGNGKGSIDFDALFRDMNKHFQENGIELPNIASPKERQNAIQQLSGFIAKHPIELNYGLGMMSGIGHMRSGFKAYQQSGAGISRMTKGFLGAAGSAGVIFLPEDKERKKNLKPFKHYLNHPAEIPKGITDFILASPIRFKGILSSFYSFLYLTDTFEERKKMKLWANEKGGKYEGKNHQELTVELGSVLSSEAMRNKDAAAISRANELRGGISELERRESIAQTTFGGVISPYLSAFTAICYLVSSLLAAASSRNRDESFEKDSEYQPMFAMAARTVAMLPERDREAALTQIATYLSSQKDVKNGEITAPQIIKEVKNRLQHIEQSPWLKSEHPMHAIA